MDSGIRDRSPPKYGYLILLISYHSIGSAERSNLLDSKHVPGPGTYTVPDKAIEGPKYVMGLKTKGGALEDL